MRSTNTVLAENVQQHPLMWLLFYIAAGTLLPDPTVSYLAFKVEFLLG